MGWFTGSKEEQKTQEVYFSAIDGLKKLYKSKILPVEEMYKFGVLNSPSLTDADFDAKPQILLMGQYSVGKTSFIKFLLEHDFPGSHIGPEPTTDRFMAIMHGQTERVIPGNALAVAADKPFRGLAQFGTAFLNKLSASQCASPILENITFVDTPGILSGQKQTIGRQYDFVRVAEWFAEKSDLILLLFDAHKLDISDEFKRVIVSLKGHDEKIRVVLNKADTVEQQQLMRVYGALMWSLGKVTMSPEVKRVYISSFWDKPFKATGNEDLFQKERDDLFKELRELPRNAALRKINDLVKRTRYVKVHALIIGKIKSMMPSMWGKSGAQQKIMDNMTDVFRQVQRENHLPFGDFPDIEKFKANIQDYDFSAFPKLDMRMIEDMDAVLSKDVPRLMNQFPTEREDAVAAMGGASAGAAGNPFDAFGGASVNPAEWSIPASDQAKYNSIFQTCNPQNGLVSGDAAKAVLLKSRLDFDTLGKVWNLSDIDEDGYLDKEEFAVAMHLCHKAMAGEPVGSKLPPLLVPPSKRKSAQAAAAPAFDPADPFATQPAAGPSSAGPGEPATYC
eukprot:m.72753 g.72753  ORF g.72753 m.72753 type:complete len:563 (+) comp14272_c0_seq2:324-2012(+)